MTYLELNRWIITLTVAVMFLLFPLIIKQLDIRVPVKVIYLQYIVAGFLTIVSGIQSCFCNTLSSKIMRYLALAIGVIVALTAIYRLFFQ